MGMAGLSYLPFQAQRDAALKPRRPGGRLRRNVIMQEPNMELRREALDRYFSHFMNQEFEYVSKLAVLGWPLVHIAAGRDPETGRDREARGILALGRQATGLFAVGLVARGVCAVGVFATGVLAVGTFALGGAVVGAVALGIRAVGAIAAGRRATGAITARFPS
jgi:hypothetical protein